VDICVFFSSFSNVGFFKGLQNTGVAIFFLRLSLPQPDSDLAIVVPIFVCIINS
jgi:hypothetical protein